MIVPPGRSFPSRSAASISPRTIRSLIEPPGFSISALATIGVRIPFAIRESLTSGVSPIVSRIESLISVAAREVVSIPGSVGSRYRRGEAGPRQYPRSGEEGRRTRLDRLDRRAGAGGDSGRRLGSRAGRDLRAFELGAGL